MHSWNRKSLIDVRRVSQCVAFGCPALVVTAMLFAGVSTPWVASAVLSLALASNMASLSTVQLHALLTTAPPGKRQPVCPPPVAAVVGLARIIVAEEEVPIILVNLV